MGSCSDSSDTHEYSDCQVMLDIVSKYQKESCFKIESIFNIFFISVKMGKLEIFADYYKRFKMAEKTDKLNASHYPDPKRKQIHDIFFNLLDSEMSITSGCSNEFVYSYLYLVEVYWTYLSEDMVWNMIMRAVTILQICSPTNASFKIEPKYKNMFEKYGNVKSANGKLKFNGGTLD